MSTLESQYRQLLFSLDTVLCVTMDDYAHLPEDHDFWQMHDHMMDAFFKLNDVAEDGRHDFIPAVKAVGRASKLFQYYFCRMGGHSLLVLRRLAALIQIADEVVDERFVYKHY